MGCIPQYDICSESGNLRLISPISCQRKKADSNAQLHARQKKTIAVGSRRLVGTQMILSPVNSLDGWPRFRVFSFPFRNCGCRGTHPFAQTAKGWGTHCRGHPAKSVALEGGPPAQLHEVGKTEARSDCIADRCAGIVCESADAVHSQVCHRNHLTLGLMSSRCSSSAHTAQLRKPK
jgi:hypothetical protein